jgi:hypothetical protein
VGDGVPRVVEPVNKADLAPVLRCGSRFAVTHLRQITNFSIRRYFSDCFVPSRAERLIKDSRFDTRFIATRISMLSVRDVFVFAFFLKPRACRAL